MPDINWLYHYTNQEGYEGIIADGTIRASTIEGKRNTHYGKGVYLTDLTPTEFKHLGDMNCINWLFNTTNGYSVQRTSHVIGFSRDKILEAGVKLREMVDRPKFGHIWLVAGEEGLSLTKGSESKHCGPTDINRRIEDEMALKDVDRVKAAGNYAYQLKKKSGNRGVFPLSDVDDDLYWPEVPMEDRLRFADPDSPSQVIWRPALDGSTSMLCYVWDAESGSYILQ